METAYEGGAAGGEEVENKHAYRYDECPRNWLHVETGTIRLGPKRYPSKALSSTRYMRERNAL